MRFPIDHRFILIRLPHPHAGPRSLLRRAGALWAVGVFIPLEPPTFELVDGVCVVGPCHALHKMI